MAHYRKMNDLTTDMLRERLLLGCLKWRQAGSYRIGEATEFRPHGHPGGSQRIGSELVIQKANKGVYVASPPTIPEQEALFDARGAMGGKTASWPGPDGRRF